MPNQEQLKVKTNIPELVTFNFDQPKTGTGQYGEWYCYGVENRGVSKTFFPTKFLNDKLQNFQPLKGKTLEIVLIEVDGGKKDWRVSLPNEGSGTTPSNSHENGSQVQNLNDSDVSERLNKMAQWAKKKDMEIEGLKTLLISLTSKEAVELHTSFPTEQDL